MVSIRVSLLTMIVSVGACVAMLVTSSSVDAGDASVGVARPPDALIEVYCPTRVRIKINGHAMSATGRYRVFRVPGSHPWMSHPIVVAATMPPRWRGCESEVAREAEPISLRPGERRVVVFYETDFLLPCEMSP